MKEELENRLITVLMPYLDPERINDAKMQITLALHGYTVAKEETQVVIYEGDVNETMLKKFLMAKIARGCSQRTVKYYKDTIRNVLREIGKPYNEVSADDIRLYMAIRVQRDKVSKTTANNERRSLSSFYTWLQKEEILLKNPMTKVEAIKERKKKKQALTQMELEKIRYACETSMEIATVEVMISTWARVSEIACIKIADIKGNSLIVHGKGDKDREVFLTPKAQLAITAYLNERNDNNPYLFPKAKYGGDVGGMTKGTQGKKKAEWYKDPEMVGEGHRDMGTIESTIRRIGRGAKVQNVHPHRFRRTGATMALKAGMPLITVSKLLGHESIATTQIYLDISDEELAQAHEKWVV